VSGAIELLKPAENASDFECPNPPNGFPYNRFGHLRNPLFPLFKDDGYFF
jgi:hypothetical protein